MLTELMHVCVCFSDETRDQAFNTDIAICFANTCRDIAVTENNSFTMKTTVPRWVSRVRVKHDGTDGTAIERADGTANTSVN